MSSGVEGRFYIQRGHLEDWASIARLLERCFFVKQRSGRRGRLRSPYLLMKYHGVDFILARDSGSVRGVIGIRRIGRQRYLIDNVAVDPVARSRNWTLILQLAMAVMDYIRTREARPAKVMIFGSFVNSRMPGLIIRYLRKQGVTISLSPVTMFLWERIRYGLQGSATVLQT
ncbi:MAG: hypothetical protein KZQ88_00810 [Candidatus Thiodiazotropha sp. (ex Dulcina madagascariensis)]|nr:hypothetical protein [Candidatus Thiodiazotropha sp. (ex Dulcina madagascariensis)]MCU7928229.1 hypothetical protein [Candidatus Thiodiazotropha sp. (ex Dulcina madagascariensis)]